MEQLLRQLTREFRAFREQVEDRIAKLEANARIETPAPVVVADEPETPAVGPAANGGADGGAGTTQEPSTTELPAGGSADPAASTADPSADATKPKGGKGKNAEAPAEQTDPAQEPGA